MLLSCKSLDANVRKKHWNDKNESNLVIAFKY